MSDSSYHTIQTLDPERYLATELPERLRQLGLEAVGSVPSTTEPLRTLSFSSDGYRFPTYAKKLFDETGVTSWSRHLSDEMWSVEYPQGDEHWLEIVHYSVLTSPDQMRHCADDLRNLLVWCESNPERMAAALSHKNRPVGVESFVPELKQRQDLSKDGSVHLPDDIDFIFVLFSVLHTTAALLQRAANSGQWVAYSSMRHEHSW